MKTILKFLAGLALLAGAALTLVLVLQFVPYGRDHVNPPVLAEPGWDSAETQALFQRACGDCHSNETVWPWYSNIAPVSWLVQHDVEEGRSRLNVSEWGRRNREVDEAAETVQEGAMPPAIYRVLHPEANLTSAERQALTQGLLRTFGAGMEGAR